jgi:hypothetical protein
VISVEPLHDDVCTQHLLDGRADELANLARVVGSRRRSTTRESGV